jgi:hypothetical protein
VLGYARTFFVGGVYRAEPLESFEAEIERFHANVGELAAHLTSGSRCTASHSTSCCRGRSPTR